MNYKYVLIKYFECNVIQMIINTTDNFNFLFTVQSEVIDWDKTLYKMFKL